jgi:hypothetical protein
MIIYINVLNADGSVTNIDSLDSSKFKSDFDFRKERNRIITEYKMLGLDCFWNFSQTSKPVFKYKKVGKK